MSKSHIDNIQSEVPSDSDDFIVIYVSNAFAHSRKAIHGRYSKLDFEDGFLYFKLKHFKDRIYLRCAINNEVNCKASYVVYLRDGVPDSKTMKCIMPHNHPPDEMAVQTEKFLHELKSAVELMDNYPLRKIYSILSEGFPELAKFYPYKVVARRMRYWRKLEQAKEKIDDSEFG